MHNGRDESRGVCVYALRDTRTGDLAPLPLWPAPQFVQCRRCPCLEHLLDAV